MKSTEYNQELAELYLNEFNEIAETYDNIHRGINNVYESISENWQGHCAANLTSSLENSKCESRTTRRMIDHTVQLMDEYTRSIRTMEHSDISEEGE